MFRTESLVAPLAEAIKLRTIGVVKLARQFYYCADQGLPLQTNYNNAERTLPLQDKQYNCRIKIHYSNDRNEAKGRRCVK